MAKRENKQLQRLRDYQMTFGSEHGRRVLNHMIMVHNVLGSTFRKGDIHETMLLEGERNAVLRILSILKEDPGSLRKRLEEHERERNDE